MTCQTNTHSTLKYWHLNAKIEHWNHWHSCCYRVHGAAENNIPRNVRVGYIYLPSACSAALIHIPRAVSALCGVFRTPVAHDIRVPNGSFANRSHAQYYATPLVRALQKADAGDVYGAFVWITGRDGRKRTVNVELLIHNRGALF